jgi:hypothetical protein
VNVCAALSRSLRRSRGWSGRRVTLERPAIRDSSGAKAPSPQKRKCAGVVLEGGGERARFRGLAWLHVAGVEEDGLAFRVEFAAEGVGGRGSCGWTASMSAQLGKRVDAVSGDALGRGSLDHLVRDAGDWVKARVKACSRPSARERGRTLRGKEAEVKGASDLRSPAREAEKRAGGLRDEEGERRSRRWVRR